MPLERMQLSVTLSLQGTSRFRCRGRGSAGVTPRLLGAVVLLALSHLGGADAASGHVLTWEDRVACQRAIEQVYYRHQEGATRPFEEAVPRGLLERKVRTYLKQSVALEVMWATPITSAMLRAELQRIWQHSLLPDRLGELFEALGDDPYRIGECLARPILVDRLARSFFAHDQRIHRETWQEAERLQQELLRGEIDPEQEHPARQVVEVPRASAPPALGQGPSRGPITGRVGPIVQEAASLVVPVALQEDGSPARLARYAVPKMSWDVWWEKEGGKFDAARFEPTRADLVRLDLPRLPSSSADEIGCGDDDTWDNGSLEMQPEFRRRATAVWTGSLMLVWNEGSVLRYDPLTDTWTTSRAPNSPEGRFEHTAVWTGREMVVWGGHSLGSPFLLNTGGRYDPVTDTWTPTSTMGVPSARRQHTAVWTGTRMIVWGGTDYTNTGGLYDPVTDSWSAISTADAPEGRTSHTAVWTGSEMIVWGGVSAAPEFIGSGGAYDPEMDAWTPTSITDAPSGRVQHTAVWTGRSMIVWGGRDASDFYTPLNTGGRYDPFSDSWEPTSTAGAPAEPLHDHRAVWTGQRMIVWGTTFELDPLTSGGRYDPGTDTWSPVSELNDPGPREEYVAVWTGNLLVVFSGVLGTAFPPGFPIFTGGRYDPVTDTWTPTSATTNGPTPRIGHTAVWTGTHMVVWGGNIPGFTITIATGSRFDPATDSWLSTSVENVPEARSFHTAVWTGERMVVWGGKSFLNGLLGSGGLYDPVTDIWEPMAGTNAPSGRFRHSAVWTGRELVVWGGFTDFVFPPTDPVGSGGRYDPAANEWRPTALAGAPSPRGDHGAVWTGARMFVWGGDDVVTSPLGDGALYDPVSDDWEPISTLRAPEPRFEHSAVWTGREVVVWSGCTVRSIRCSPLTSGGRYDPVTDTWNTISLTNVPEARRSHSAVWTGNLMVVWGGVDARGFGLRSGGRYDPARDAWETVSTVDAPEGGFRLPAVWTGKQMIVLTNLGTGGRYAVVRPADEDLDGLTVCEGDCDDADPFSFPGAEERCDGFDNDCDGMLSAEEADADGDGYPICRGDCDDSNPAVNPGRPDLPGNALDEDCDGTVRCDPSAAWRNHGQFIRCVARECERLVEAGRVTQQECERLISRAGLLKTALQ